MNQDIYKQLKNYIQLVERDFFLKDHHSLNISLSPTLTVVDLILLEMMYLPKNRIIQLHN